MKLNLISQISSFGQSYPFAKAQLCIHQRHYIDNGVDTCFLNGQN